MLPFRPVAPGHPIYLPSVAEPVGPASEALYRLAASRSVGPWYPPPLGYFSQPFPPPFSNGINAPFMGYHQPPELAWRINPVYGVSPILHPADTAHGATVAPSTGIKPVSLASSPERTAQKTASPNQTDAGSSGQTVVDQEIDVVKADDIAKPLDNNRAGTADSTQPTRKRPNKGPRSRTVFTMHQLRIMRDRFDKHRHIDRPEAHELACVLGITEKSLSIWFSNERRRVKLTSNLPDKPQLSRGYARRQVSDLFATSEIRRPNDALIEQDTRK